MNLGVDIGGTTTHGVVLDRNGHVVAEKMVATGHGARELVERTQLLAEDLATRAGLSLRGLRVGVGVPGRVDPDAGVVETAVNLGVSSVALGPLLAARLGTAVCVDNDVKATALGAATLLGALDTSLTFVNFGTGVASATADQGRLLRGHANLAGEIGHLPLDAQGATCPCGQRGCLETVLGGRRIAERLQRLSPGLTNRTLFSSHLPAVVAERERIVDAVVRTLIVVALAYGSDHLVLGGGMLRHTTGLLDAVLDAVDRAGEGSPLLGALQIGRRISELPVDRPVGAIGAAMLVMSPDRVPLPGEVVA